MQRISSRTLSKAPQPQGYQPSLRDSEIRSVVLRKAETETSCFLVRTGFS